MKKNKKRWIAVWLAGMFFMETGAHIVYPCQAASAYFSLVEDSIQIMVGETDFIEVNLVADSMYGETDLKWSSQDEEIAAIDADGIVTGIAVGDTTVTATMPDGSSNTCKIVVQGYMNTEDDPNYNYDETENSDPDDYDETPDFTSLTLPKKITLYVGGNDWAELSFEPEGADEELITWKSSNPKVATVNDGLITGIKSGTVQIIAMTPNDITATCTVTVEKPSIVLEKNKVKLKVGKRYSIKAACFPDTIPTFKSQNSAVAKVTANGVIKAKKKGKTAVVVKANGVSKKVTVTVVKQ